MRGKDKLLRSVTKIAGKVKTSSRGKATIEIIITTLFIHLFICLFIHLFNYLCIYLLIDLLSYLFLFIYLVLSPGPLRCLRK